MYFRFIKVNFPFTEGEGKRRKLSFPSRVDNFRPTFRSPRYFHTFIASYDAKNELKSVVYPIANGYTEPLLSEIEWLKLTATTPTET